MRSAHHRSFLAALVAAAVLVIACSAAPAPASPSPTPSAPPSVDPSSPPVTPAPTIPPSPSIPPSSPAPPTPDPEPSFSAAEQALLRLIRPDARRDCEPRRSDLPSGALAGVECRPGTRLVARVGAYRFASDAAATTAYLERIVASGVEPRSGDCHRGVPGDAAWTPGDDVGEVAEGDPYSVMYRGIPYVVARYGCFVNAEGVANFRTTCGDVYTGVLGRDDDVAALTSWSWEFAADAPPSTPSSPGICYHPMT
jgi:hypothetical protein